MVLDQERGIIAERLRLDIVFNELFISGRGIRTARTAAGGGAAEKAEPHQDRLHICRSNLAKITDFLNRAGANGSMSAGPQRLFYPPRPCWQRSSERPFAIRTRERPRIV